jgi:glutamate 5-kinase
MAADPRRARGELGESVAARHLTQLGYEVLARNYRTRHGELDLVAADGRVVARGLVEYAAGELPKLLGRSTRELAAELGPAYEREVVHRDDLVVLLG